MVKKFTTYFWINILFLEVKQIFNKEIGKRRIIIENLFSRLKLFKILKDYKYPLELHGKIFYAVAILFQINNLFHPLRK